MNLLEIAENKGYTCDVLRIPPRSSLRVDCLSLQCERVVSIIGKCILGIRMYMQISCVANAAESPQRAFSPDRAFNDVIRCRNGAKLKSHFNNALVKLTLRYAKSLRHAKIFYYNTFLQARVQSKFQGLGPHCIRIWNFKFPWFLRCIKPLRFFLSRYKIISAVKISKNNSSAAQLNNLYVSAHREHTALNV